MNPSKQELRKQIAVDQGLETVIQLMRQACVSAYEDGQAQNSAARLQLDEDYIRSSLLAWRAAYSNQREVEARIDELEAVRAGNDGFEVPYQYDDESRVDILDRLEQLRATLSAPQPLSPEQRGKP